MQWLCIITEHKIHQWGTFPDAHCLSETGTRLMLRQCMCCSLFWCHASPKQRFPEQHPASAEFTRYQTPELQVEGFDWPGSQTCFAQLQQCKTDSVPAYWQAHRCDKLPGGNKSTFCISPRAKHLVERCQTGITTCFCSPLAPARRKSNQEPEIILVSHWIHAGFR